MGMGINGHIGFFEPAEVRFSVSFLRFSIEIAERIPLLGIFCQGIYERKKDTVDTIGAVHPCDRSSEP